MSQKFEISLLAGQHLFLKSLESNYKGITRVGFESTVIGDELSCSGTPGSISERRFFLHEYTFVSALTT